MVNIDKNINSIYIQILSMFNILDMSIGSLANILRSKKALWSSSLHNFPGLGGSPFPDPFINFLFIEIQKSCQISAFYFVF